MQSNRILQKLRQGQAVLVPTVWTVPHWKIVEMMGVVGFDGVWVEMEHSDFTYEQLSQMALAARATGMDVIVRVAKGGYNDLIRPLEAGATGLMLPHCTGPEEAREFVRAARFQPFGWRGVGGSVDSRYGTVPFPEYVEWANREILLSVMIERREAVEQIEGIAATEGLDLLFIGPYDLSQSYGLLGQVDHPSIREAVDRTAQACAKHGKWWGLSCGLEQARPVFDQGARFFNPTSEMGALMSGFRSAKEQYAWLGAGS
jgi:2-keto-3-deoxy-L-rhamnonate aldolase RhmA